MDDRIRVVAITGTYRKGGIIDKAVDEILASAREGGAEAIKIYLIDKQIEFCRNCRTCTQEKGERRGQCCILDDMGGILEQIGHADAIVLASPVNFGTVTAVMKRFIERLICFSYWPWGANAPKPRSNRKDKRAVVVVSSAAPSFLARLSTSVVALLKTSASLLGARTVGVLFIGLAAKQSTRDLGEKTREKAHRLGKELIDRQ
ncbi:MAG TPA: flavodoxin family protein [Thermodesulfobacteriota bacterium]|nr:flavodoxin family protein [Deltaproteobacteria bacterium]HNR12538.1 flavodoxin family protein [Thermodesulfobacteriota bacterium]HNU72342.1 flavodoxin family protein [Thermodesulfobacteriota bacterium]HQO78405.1 flavodoxin family protein [Thermodesulfobacteriota bacterium]